MDVEQQTVSTTDLVKSLKHKKFKSFLWCQWFAFLSIVTILTTITLGTVIGIVSLVGVSRIVPTILGFIISLVNTLMVTFRFPDRAKKMKVCEMAYSKLLTFLVGKPQITQAEYQHISDSIHKIEYAAFIDILPPSRPKSDN
jgi:hypothetical protein